MSQQARLRIQGEAGIRICFHSPATGWVESGWILPDHCYRDVWLDPGDYSFAGHVHDAGLSRYTDVTSGLARITLGAGDDEQIMLKSLVTSWAPGNIQVLVVRGGEPATGVQTWWYEEWQGDWTWFYKDEADAEGIVAWEECFWDEANGCGAWARFVGEAIFPIIAISDHVVLPTDTLAIRATPRTYDHGDIGFVGGQGRWATDVPLPRYEMREKWPWWEYTDHCIPWQVVEHEGAVGETFEMPGSTHFVVGHRNLAKLEVPDAT